jgi:hypothetical protein
LSEQTPAENHPKNYKDHNKYTDQRKEGYNTFTPKKKKVQKGLKRIFLSFSFSIFFPNLKLEKKIKISKIINLLKKMDYIM